MSIVSMTEFTCVPHMAVWELTLACNMRCRHCAAHAGRARPDELDTAEALDLCRALADAGCTRVGLTGGEPLLRTDWAEIAAELASLGMGVGLVSNGKLFDRSVGERAQAAGVESMVFSLDGLQESHDWLRRESGSFARVLDGLRICGDLGLTASAISSIHIRNIDELEAIYELLRDEGVSGWRMQLYAPSYGDPAGVQMQIPPERLTGLIALLADLRGRRELDVGVGVNIGFYGGYEEDLRGDLGVRGEDQAEGFGGWLGCTAGLDTVGIDSSGNILGCNVLAYTPHPERFIEGNIRQRSFADIWNDPDGFAYNRAFHMDLLAGGCRICEYGDICRGGCLWQALCDTGTWDHSRYCIHHQLTDP